MPIVQDALADAKHHGTVTMHQDRKGVLIAMDNETTEQLAVRLASGRYVAKVSENVWNRYCRHRRSPPGT